LFSRGCGWFHDSFLFYRSICSHASAHTFDFSRDVTALLELVQDEELFAFSHIRTTTNVTMSFFRQVRHPVGLRKFRLALSDLSNAQQHVILCFTTSQMRWSFLSTPRRFCPNCGASWHWDHFFSCPDIVGVASSRRLSLSKLRCDIAQSDWHSVFIDVAHIMLVWSFSLNRDPNLCLSYDVDVFRSIMLLPRS
jgi:hypothetical protein